MDVSLCVAVSLCLCVWLLLWTDGAQETLLQQDTSEKTKQTLKKNEGEEEDKVKQRKLRKDLIDWDPVDAGEKSE